MVTLGLSKKLHAGYDDVLARVPAALQSEGFGVLTRIDVRDTLQQKIGVDFRRYQILGACNPALAHEALQLELELGIMLPCNVIVYEADDGTTVVTAVDPARTIAAASTDPKLATLAQNVRDKLGRALARLE